MPIRPIGLGTRDFSGVVGATSEVVVEFNHQRKRLYVVNTHATQYLNIQVGAIATATSGMRLNPAGGAFVMDDTNLDVRDIHMIGSGANTTFTCSEASG